MIEQVTSILNKELFHIGSNTFTMISLIVLIVSLLALFFITSLIKKLLVKRIFPRYKMDRGTAESIATIIRYVIVIIGLMIIMRTSGIDISSLGILFGAIGIGIGFGLQSISNNFISGIIILFERPVKVGDRIEVEGVAGNIVKISGRATTIITNDNIAIIVPNSELINSKVTNWSLNDHMVRFNFPVFVSYKEDPQRIKEILLEVAGECGEVLKDPLPDVLFEEFADNSLIFNLRVWATEYSDKPKVLKSILYYEIFEKFKQHNIEIPYPQRDLHIISGEEKLKNVSV
jgi:small-conductance mechanosensitive channel